MGAKGNLFRLLALLIVLITQLCIASSDEVDNNTSSPPKPVFPDNYSVRGLLSLPYAELNEPFHAWYDKGLSRSRTDYYGDLYKIYQYGSKSAPEKQDKFGAMYKFAYVPASFQPTSSRQNSTRNGVLSKINDAFHRLYHHNHVDNKQSKTATRRACFSVKGAVGNTIQAQTVLPDLNDFSFDSMSHCPHINAEHRHSSCELWKLVTNVGEKKNTYKMWIKRDSKTGAVIPVHYYMLGFDSLLGSHYDRYDVSYFNFMAGGANDADFHFDASAYKCESMPGPGDSSPGERRSHMIIANPIHEYVVEPHRYDHIDHEFSDFVNNHQKTYESDKHQKQSWLNFLHNFRFINGKNRELKEYKLGVNRYADNSLKELSYLRGRTHSSGYNGGLDYEQHHKLKGANGQLSAQLPDEWDWTRRGAVTPVKDQAVCGSCWSFGTSGTIEGAYFVKTGKLVKLSQQQLVDCSWAYGNNGCDGGEDFRAYNYVMKAGGLSSEEEYGHYMGVDGKCHDNDVEKSVKIKGFYNVTTNDVEALKHAIVNYGPVTIAIDASRPTFTFYSHGVYYDEKCNNSPDGLDHQVLAVGYMKIDGKFVWIVKNSWSTYWGDDGYILMSAENNNCGVMDSPTVPIIDA